MTLKLELAHRVVMQFLQEWQWQPHRWWREIDVQVEIASRLQRALALVGLDRMPAVFPKVGKGQASVIHCEPGMVREPEATKGLVHPDIVMWEHMPPGQDERHVTTGEVTALWACEIKYTSGQSSDGDVEKLRKLQEGDRLRCGAFVQMDFQKVPMPNISRRLAPGAGEIWHYEAHLPK